MGMLSNPIPSFAKCTFLSLALAGCALPVTGTPPEKPKAAGKEKEKDSEPGAPALVEAFQKGPITFTGKVVHAPGTPEESSLPVFQVPVLKFQDRLELSFSGEAFDQRVTRADWSVVVVFLPRTVAPTDQGVVSFRLKRKDDQMVVPAIPVPYDSIPMFFLIPDKNGRKKVLKDLNDHLEAFRNLCSKICELSEERASADTFLEDLGAIDKNLSAAQYDNAVLGFLHAYGNSVSGDLQAFVGGSRSNLEKFQFLTQEFRKTNVLVPESGTAPVEAQVSVGTGSNRATSAYISIFFDLAGIIKNLWPGHQFQYLPALARNFHGPSADLYYSDWIHTTGETLGALMCCPGKWEDQTPPAFELELPEGESILKPQALLKAHPKEKNRNPFSLFGHDWKLLATGPKGEPLPPLSLAASPGKASFVATPAPLLDPLRKLGPVSVKLRVIGRWGFTSIATDPLELPVSPDPAWTPSPAEKAAFQAGKDCTFTLPKSWASIVDQVSFRPARSGVPPLFATLKDGKEGTRTASFGPKPELLGAGFLEIKTFGQDKPAFSVPITLLPAPPEPAALEARLGEEKVILRGRHLEGIQALELEGRRFVPKGMEAPDGMAFRAEDGKPLEGTVGRKLAGAMILAPDRKVPLENGALMPARPRLAEVLVAPMESKANGILVTSTLPIASTTSPSQVSLITAKGYRFPSDRGVHALVRNAEEPAEVRTIPPAKFRIMGNNQKATFLFTPSDLLGGRASGTLEVQVQDDHSGPGDWMPLPAAFLDLPTISSVQADPSGLGLTGPSLDPIEALAPSPTGPWEKISVAIEDGRQVIKSSCRLTGDQCYLKVFGWPEVVLRFKFPTLSNSLGKPGAPPPEPTSPQGSTTAEPKGKSIEAAGRE
jgi:hypothetical protein